MAVYTTIEAVKPKRQTGHPGGIELRDEQEQAVGKAIKYFRLHKTNASFLWNAKMRFGKTVCALELAKRMGCLEGDDQVIRTIIVTHRPVVNDSWKVDFTKVFGEDCTTCHYGTPFNLYEDFADGQIYTWDYIKEQTAKRGWLQNHPDQPKEDNPYRELPDITSSSDINWGADCGRRPSALPQVRLVG